MRLTAVLALLLLFASSVVAFEAVGTIRSVDPDQRILRVFANGQLRTVKVAPDAKILDKAGKDLAGGLKSTELKDGVEVTLTVEPMNGMPTITAIRIGRPAANPGTPVSPDHSRLKPLPELGKEQYQGFTGGLYPDGKNERPAAHEALGLSLARKVEPLDAEGKPFAEGRIVLLTIGMSNTSQSTEGFLQALNADTEKNPRLLVVNGAQGGMTAARIQNPNDGASGSQYWNEVDNRLRRSNAVRAQVQAIWLKQADGGPNQGFPTYAKTLQAELARIVQSLPARFPNLKLVYLSSRTYGGYASTRLNPEPYAYESGFAVKWLIEQQLKGEPELNCDPAKGPVKAPWLSWGPYLWANGSVKRADGFTYQREDFVDDGTHQSRSGQQKVGGLLLQFFKSDSTTRRWFRASG